jgi:hypothetical protein
MLQSELFNVQAPLLAEENRGPNQHSKGEEIAFDMKRQVL